MSVICGGARYASPHLAGFFILFLYMHMCLRLVCWCLSRLEEGAGSWRELHLSYELPDVSSRSQLLRSGRHF